MSQIDASKVVAHAALGPLEGAGHAVLGPIGGALTASKIVAHAVIDDAPLASSGGAPVIVIGAG